MRYAVVLILLLAACGKSAYMHVGEGAIVSPAITITGKDLTYAHGSGALKLVTNGKEIVIEGKAEPEPDESTPPE